MNGIKSQELSKWNMNDFHHTLWKFDYSGIGDSVGKLEFKNWLKDAETILHTAYEEHGEKVDIIGSSMGAFISLHLALSNPDMIRSMFLCAPAKDFMKANFDQIMNIPGDNIPIPVDYLHSSGLNSIPKECVD